jgi:RNA polymerase sigma factor (sigma-70 family)
MIPPEQAEQLAHRIARQTRRANGDTLSIDELVQAARIAIWQATMIWDSSRGVALVNWVSLRAYGRARHAIRDARRQRGGNPVQIHERHQQCQLRPLLIDLDRALEILDPDDRRLILELYREGRTLREAAELRGMSIPAMHWRRDRALAQMREYLSPTTAAA